MIDTLSRRSFPFVLASFVVLPINLANAQDKPRAEADRVFRAGAATSNITPSIGAEVVGGFTPYPSKHVHDELHARCLVLDDGQTKVGFAICDNVGIPREVFDAV